MSATSSGINRSSITALPVWAMRSARGGSQGLAAAGQVVHELLAFVHRPDLAQVGHAGVADLPREQACEDHARDPAAVAECSIGQLAHEADAAAAVNEADAPSRQ